MRFITSKPFYLFILCNVLSAGMMFADIRSGMLFSIFLVGVLALYFLDILKIFLRPEHRFFQVLYGIEVLSMLHYLTNPLAIEFVGSYPRIVPEIISYILIPQLVFYWLGTKIGTNARLTEYNFKGIMWVNMGFIFLSLVLHFWHPAFYIDFMKQYGYGTIVISDGKNDFTPRLNGYMVSMILGIVCASSLVLAVALIKNRVSRYLVVLVFMAGALFSLQRGAWAAVLIGFAALIPIHYQTSGRRWGAVIRSFLPELGVSVLLLAVGLLLIDAPALFDNVEKYGEEIWKRIDNLDSVYSERDDQPQNAKTVLEAYPMGIGVGLLTAKGADQNFRYTVPDTIYYRFFAELGYLGGLAVLVFLGMMAWRLYQKSYYLALIHLLYILQAFGTAVFEHYYGSFIFWLMAGVAFTKFEGAVPRQNKLFRPSTPTPATPQTQP